MPAKLPALARRSVLLPVIIVTLTHVIIADAIAQAADASIATNRRDVLVVDNTPDLESSGDLRRVVEQLEKEGVAKRSDPKRSSASSGFYAELTVHAASSGDSIRQLLITLKELGITRVSLRLTVGADNHVIVHAPADASWHRVRRIEETLARQAPFFVTQVRVAAQADGEFIVQFTYDGPRPDVKKLAVSRDAAVFGAEVADESLLVGDTSGLANVAVYVTSIDIPVHPELKRRAERPAELSVRSGGIRPRIVPFLVSQQLKLINDLPVGVNFNWAARANSPINVVVPAKGAWESTVEKAERMPTAVTDSIHPWLVGYFLPLDHPYAAVSGQDGIARLTHLPEGEWAFRFWHEKGGFLKSAETGLSEFGFTIGPGENQLKLRVSPEFTVSTAQANVLDPPATAEKSEPAAFSPAVKPVHGGIGVPKIESFEYPVTTEAAATIDELRQRFSELEERIAQLAARLQQSSSDAEVNELLKKSLRDSVGEAFHTRQRLQRGELLELTRRLEKIQRTIEKRDQISQQIIDQRVEELLESVPPRTSGRLGPTPAAPNGSDNIMAALQEVHDLCSERTGLRIHHRNGHSRFAEIERRIADLHNGPLGVLQTVASDAILACSEEPQFGQPAYGIILHATAVDDIAEDELLLFHADRVYRGRHSFHQLATDGEGWYFRPNGAVPKGTRFVVACIQDAPEEIENVRRGSMPNSNRARDPERPYRTQVFHPDGTPLLSRRR